MDRIVVQVQFKKALWTCPFCKQEDVEDRPMGGGASYEHTCSACGKKFNQSGPNMKEYNGSINYSEAEYKSIADKAIEDEKTARYDAWIYEVKNPPAYVEPSKADLEREKAELEARVAKLSADIAMKTVEAVVDAEIVEK